MQPAGPCDDAAVTAQKRWWHRQQYLIGNGVEAKNGTIGYRVVDMHSRHSGCNTAETDYKVSKQCVGNVNNINDYLDKNPKRQSVNHPDYPIVCYNYDDDDYPP